MATKLVAVILGVLGVGTAIAGTAISLHPAEPSYSSWSETTKTTYPIGQKQDRDRLVVVWDPPHCSLVGPRSHLAATLQYSDNAEVIFHDLNSDGHRAAYRAWQRCQKHAGGRAFAEAP